MGAVYRARQVSVDREVAIKVIDPRLSSNRSVVKRFLREVRLSGRLGQLYMAPEQIAGAATDARTDLYALGCMLHEMLGGRPPFGAPSVERVMANHIYELAAPLPDDVPPALAELIRRLIGKHAADRP